MLELNNLYLMDCMHGMHEFPDGYFDLAIVDPPYGLDKSSTQGSGKLKNRTFNTGNISTWDEAPQQDYFDELFRVSKNQVIWGGNYFNLPPTRCVLCWDKCQPWENFSQIELAWTGFDSPAQIFRFDNRTGDKIHPCQKPIELYIWILDKYAKSGFRILDTHVGSASSLIACRRLGFEYIGFEINKGYYESAVNRMKSYAIPKRLF